ncbi:DoxX family protein [Poritiphilus flavus]|uniref:DoxX family protein n=1 Tax=Poritiphilus flavus TaxID=2697053 RepID=A0A6L9E972_9FLAO|nr:DoxX family protein [Poritiphilus flavus]NAS11325.1 DoxX family protein [Poritiphilus flavus]
MKTRIINYFLKLALAAGFLSAVADRFGLWPEDISAWGNWANFTAYTALINPLVPDGLIPALAAVATAAELVLAVLLLSGFKTVWVARISGALLLLFGLAMTFSTGLKGALDYSVFSAAAAAFGLSALEAIPRKPENELV